METFYANFALIMLKGRRYVSWTRRL